MNISLFYMSNVGMGGFVKYTSELYKAFEVMGHDVALYKIRSKWDKKLKDFNEGVQSRNISIEDAKTIIAKSDAAIVTATWWNGWHDSIAELILCGAEVVIHDRTEYEITVHNREFDSLVDFLRDYGIRPIVIRKVNVDNLAKKGLESVYIPHPYNQIMDEEFRKSKDLRPVHAVSVCRMDFDKRTHIMIAANQRLPYEKRIQFWGSHVRLYMFTHVMYRYKGWTDGKHFCGPGYPLEQHNFSKEDGFAVKVNSTAEFSVDMSRIVGEGGGTQYSFLQAMDAGAVVVLSTDWLISDHDEMGHQYNCVAVAGVNELTEFLRDMKRSSFTRVIGGAESVLNRHKPKVVVPQYIKFFEGKI